jgi:hypothetical protein
MVTERYGTPPDIFYAHVPVSIDNVANAIESD